MAAAMSQWLRLAVIMNSLHLPILGDLLQGSGEVTKRGGSMVFARCVLRVEDTVILTSSAVIKRIRMQK